MSEIVALDLFAGTGWGVACQRIGIEELGVEIMPEAVATRTANGMATIFSDVWDGLLCPENIPAVQDLIDRGMSFADLYQALIASPPCQTFSAAGNGAGRKALRHVIQAIEDKLYQDPARLIEFGEIHDPRTALVLAPLAYIWRDKPRWVALEQVPTVQPVWEAYATIMREWGYSVETRILNAEQYGVPQTRRRAILVAHLNGPVSLPTPTHSRYYPRNPSKLDPGVKKWVSMAEALGWGMTARPYLTVTGGGDRDTSKHSGDPVPSALGSKGSRERVTSEYEAGRWIEPDTTDRQLRTPSGELKMLASELAALQSFPPTDVVFTQNKNQPNQARRTLDQPAPTVTAGKDYDARGFLREDGSVVRATHEQVAAFQSYPPGTVYRNGNHPQGWGFTNRPATTVTGHGDVTRCSTGSKVAVVNAVEAGEYVFRPPYTEETAVKADYQPQDSGYIALGEMFERDAVNCSPEDNARIQSYPAEPMFTWCGSRSKVFLQIGNAVPPLLAQAILSELFILG